MLTDQNKTSSSCRQKTLAELGSNESTVDRSFQNAFAFVATLPDLVAECNQGVTLKLVADDAVRFPVVIYGT